MTDSAPAGESRVVTQDDINLVVDAMIRRDVGWLRKIGFGAEVLGWVGFIGAFLVSAIQWDSLNGRDAFADTEPEVWKQLTAFVLPMFINLACAGALLIVLGRGARLFALHMAGRRGMNVSGLTLGEPLDLDLEED